MPGALSFELLPFWRMPEEAVVVCFRFPLSMLRQIFPPENKIVSAINAENTKEG